MRRNGGIGWHSEDKWVPPLSNRSRFLARLYDRWNRRWAHVRHLPAADRKRCNLYANLHG